MAEKTIDNSIERTPELGDGSIERTLWTARTLLAENDPEGAFCTLYDLAHDERVVEPHYVSRINQIMAEAALADNRYSLAHTYLWRALSATNGFRHYGEFNTMHVYRASIFCSFAIAASLEDHSNDVETYMNWARRELASVQQDPDMENAVKDLHTWINSHSFSPDFILHVKDTSTALVTLHATLPSPGSSPVTGKGEFMGYSPKTYLTPETFRSPDTLA